MKNITKILLINLFLINYAYSDNQNHDYGVVFPKTDKITTLQEDRQDLQWNRYTTKNFTVISIDNKEGVWLSKNLDLIKDSCLKKWGITGGDLSTECRIMVVDNKDLFKKFFNITDPRVEFRKKDGKTEIIGVWLCIEKNNHEDLEKIISQICFQDMLEKKNTSKKFIEIGIPLLNQKEEKIKKIIKNLTPDISFIEKKDEDYKKLKELEKTNFEENSAIFCLMLKKELGEKKFLELMFSKGKNLDQIIKVYGYKDLAEIEMTFKRYCKDLKNSVEKNEITSKYLKVERDIK